MVFKVERCGPIITESLVPKEIFDNGLSYNNINGPSLIEAPEWLPQKLGRYYLYFANHKSAD